MKRMTFELPDNAIAMAFTIVIDEDAFNKLIVDLS